MIKWNTDSDTFELGEWSNGGLYPRRSDLSPDGTKLITFSLREGTIISKPPWLTPLIAWPGGDTHFGGGLFETNGKVWSNQFYLWDEGSPFGAIPSGFQIEYEHLFWDLDWLFLYRMERDGWKPMIEYPWRSVDMYGREVGGPISATSLAKIPEKPVWKDGKVRTVHEKFDPSGSYSLTWSSTYPVLEGYWNQNLYEVKNISSGTIFPFNDGYWADWDQRGRFVYTSQGKLFAAEVNASGRLNPREIVDFNSSKPEKTNAPDWARMW